MTIIVSAHGHHVAVLAADGHERLIPLKSHLPMLARVTQKIRADPIRPVAVAITGLARVQGADVFTHIGELISAYGDERALDAIQIARYLGNGLHAAVVAEVADARRAGVIDIVGVTLFVASWNGDRPSVARAEVQQQGVVVLEQDDAVMLSTPTCLAEFSAAMPRVHYEGDDALERQAVEVVRSAITEERRLHDGANEHCGGPIMSALVAAGDVTLHSWE